MRLIHIFLTIVALATMSCGGGYQSVAADIDADGWTTPAHLAFAVSDSTSLHRLRLFLRHRRTESPDSVELLVKTMAPDSTFWSERFVIYPNKGDKSDYGLTEVDYRHRVKWQQAGVYHMTLYPQHIYKGIEATGISIKLEE